MGCSEPPANPKCTAATGSKHNPGCAADLAPNKRDRKSPHSNIPVPLTMATSTSLIPICLCLMLLAGSCNALRPAMFTHSEPQQPAASEAVDTGSSTSNHRSLLQVPYGAIVGGVQAGVNAGIGIVAPVVSGLASNIPIMVPSFQGHCMNGEPIAPLKSKPDQIWCVVASGAELTDGFFRAFSGLTSVAGNVAGMFLNRGH